jgi:hypothetical protein
VSGLLRVSSELDVERGMVRVSESEYELGVV